MAVVLPVRKIDGKPDHETVYGMQSDSIIRAEMSWVAPKLRWSKIRFAAMLLGCYDQRWRSHTVFEIFLDVRGVTPRQKLMAARS